MTLVFEIIFVIYSLLIDVNFLNITQVSPSVDRQR